MSADPAAVDARGARDMLEAQRTEIDLAWREFGAATTPEAYCRSWLALQCQVIGGVDDAVLILQKPGSDAFAPLAFWPDASRDRSRLAGITERAMREGRGIVDPVRGEGGLRAYQLVYPVRLDGAVRGAVALELQPREEAALQTAMRALQWGSAWIEVLLRRHADPGEAARLRVKLLLQMLAAFLERSQFKEAATALTTEIASQLGCDRVTLAVLSGGTLRIEAVSHAVQFDRATNLLQATVAALQEAIDQREAIVYPPERDARLTVTFAHAELVQHTGAGGVVSLPLLHAGRVLGALGAERAPGLRFDAQAVELLDGLAALLAPLLDLHLARDRSLVQHARDAVRLQWRRLAGPGYGGYKVGAALVAVLGLALTFATGTYRVSADARIEGEIQRALTAPFQGFLRDAAHRAGDRVRHGDTLARLDDRDLRLEHARLSASREQYTKQYREAMAKRDRTQIAIVTTQLRQVEAQLALAEEQLARTAIVAPFDGVLVTGDLSQSLGAPVERGQTLFEIAPLDAYRVILEVDERYIGEVRIDQPGELVLSSMPNERLGFKVANITPVNTAREGRNFFRVEGRFSGVPAPQLRPGMEGVGKLVVDERRLLWIWTHALVDWVKLKLWSWLP